MAVWMIFQSKRTRIFSLATIIFFVVILSFPSFLIVGETDSSSTIIVDEDSLFPVLNDIEKFDTLSAIDYSALWNRTYGGFDQDRISDLTICSEGGYALVGYTDSFTEGDKDVWVVRTNMDGSVIWTTSFGNTSSDDRGQSIVECENGDFIIGGFSYTGAAHDARVDRLDKDGNLLWTNQVGLSATDDIFMDIIETKTESIIAVGQTSSWGVGGTDVLAICLDANGNEIWIRTYGGASEDHSNSIIECDEGGFAILGYTLSFGEGGYDYWLLRLGIDGNLLWDSTYGGSNNDQGFELVQNIFGGFVLAGNSKSLGDISGDFWVISVDSNGDEIWNATYVSGGVDFATGIVECARGGYAVVGILDYISGVDKTRLVRIDNDGTELWSSIYDGGVVDSCYSIVETYPEEFALAGYTNSYGAGSFDAWLLLIPGAPRITNPPYDQFVEYGNYIGVSLFVESTADIDSWWLTDDSVFQIAKIGYTEGVVYSMTFPDVGYYEVFVHVNNTVGYEAEHFFTVYVDDTTSPSWIYSPENQTVEFGNDLQYQLFVDDLSNISDWSLSGSTQFSIDSNGIITSIDTPDVGIYLLEVSVNDIYHNTLSCMLMVTFQDTIAPSWIETPVNSNVTYGEAFVYDLNATDYNGISAWWTNNPEKFSIDWEGRLRNIVTLAPGDHAITVYVSDPYGNILEGNFVLIVEGSLTSVGTIPDFLNMNSMIPFIAGVFATIAIVTIVLVVRRPRSKSE